MKNALIVSVALAVLGVMMYLAIPAEERRGCCSWHGGVCGCQGGRVVCCDGTFSPSCGCAK